MTNMKRFFPGTGMLMLLAILAGCNGKEDFSDVDLPGCPAGGLCEEQPSGDVLVEFVGPRFINLGYRCGTSVSRISGEPQEIGGRIVPAGAALCPEGVNTVDFFLGDGLYLGNSLLIGRAALPQTAILTQVGEDGTNWGLVRLTVADIVNTARRLPASDNRVRNRAALLMALDSDPATDDVEIHPALQGRDGLINMRYIELVQGNSLETEDYTDFTNAWAPLLTALAEEDDLPVTYVFPDEATVTQRTAYGMDLTRSGLFSMVFQESELAILELIGTDKQRADEYIGALEGSLLVLPTGEALGLVNVLLSYFPGGTEEAETEQDTITFQRGAGLNNELALQNMTLQGLMNTDVSTNLTMTGRMLGDFLYNGVKGQNGTDVGLNMPGMSYTPEAADFGRINGTFLGTSSADMLLKDPDPAPVGLPMRIARSGLGASSIDQDALDAATGVYRLQLRRGCTALEQPDGALCTALEEKNKVNYPQEYQIDDDEEADPITFTFVSDTPRGNDGTGPDEMLIEIRRVGEHAIIFAGQSGACPSNNSATDFPVGYVSRTFVEAGVPASVNVVMLMTGDASEQDNLYQFGTEIQGRIDVQDGSRPMYRLSDESFDDQVAAQWIDSYLPVKYYQGLNLGEDETMTNDQSQTLLSYVQGSVDLTYLGATCPP